MTKRYIVTRCAVLVAIAFSCGGCGRLLEWSLGPGENLGHSFEELGRRSNRLVIQTRDHEVKKDTASQVDIATVLNFFKRYPAGWVKLSGAGGDYNIFLYEGTDLIGRLGVTQSSRVRPGEDTLNVSDNYRRVPASEVVVLMRQLGLPWPVGSR